MSAPTPVYVYAAVVASVIDGDTIRCSVDLGFSTWTRQVFRLKDVLAPEVVGVERASGLRVKSFVSSILPIGTSVMVQTFKPLGVRDKYGRYVARIWAADGSDVNATITEYIAAVEREREMVSRGSARG